VRFTLSFSLAQNKTEQLINQAASLPENQSKVDLYNQISNLLAGENPEQSLNYANQALRLSNKINYTSGIAYSYKSLGLTKYFQGKYVDALGDWQTALQVFDSIGDKTGTSNMYSNMGAIYNIQGDDVKALDMHLKSLTDAESVPDTLRILTSLINIGAVYSNKPSTQDKALEYYKKALPLSRIINDKDAIGTVTVNMGEIYLGKEQDSIALFYFLQSLEAYEENSENIPYTLNNIGKVYTHKKDYVKAIEYHQQAYSHAIAIDAKLEVAQSLLGLAASNVQLQKYKEAISYYDEAEQICKSIDANYELKEAYEGLANVYSLTKDFGNAFRYQTLLIGIKDTIFSIATDKKLSGMMFNFEMDKKQGEIDLLVKDNEIQKQVIGRQRLIRNVFIGGFAVVLLFASVFLIQRNRISTEKKRSEELLLNILPADTANELKNTGSAKAKHFDLVTIMFTDFKNFTQASEKLSAEELVEEIHYCYSAFDRIMEKHGIEKIKTIGDSYMCASGIPSPNEHHAVAMTNAAIEILSFIAENKIRRAEIDKPWFDLRIGIHSGPVVAGIVGTKKFAYDIWGDAVNTASRMESSGETNKINISEATHKLIKDQFVCVSRGKISAKNKGEIEMFFVEGVYS